MDVHKITKSQAEHQAALQKNPYFARLDQQALSDLVQEMSLRAYKPDEVICWQGEPCEGLFILNSGAVKLFKMSPKGRELIIKIFEEGSTFNEVPVFDQGVNPINVAALGECQVWLVKAEAIRNCMDKNPGMADAVIQNLSANLRTLVDVVEELSFFQVTNRLARLLSRMPAEQLEERITQDQLAARLGTVREVVARSLRDLERSGAIRIVRRQIQIADRDLLRDWAQDGST